MVNSVYNNHPNYHTDAFGSKAETCQIAMWAYAAHPCGYFSFTRKVSKSVSKGLPLRYPLGQVTVKAGGANQNDAPSP